jgi:hypothetical protein
MKFVGYVPQQRDIEKLLASAASRQFALSVAFAATAGARLSEMMPLQAFFLFRSPRPHAYLPASGYQYAHRLVFLPPGVMSMVRVKEHIRPVFPTMGAAKAETILRDYRQILFTGRASESLTFHSLRRFFESRLREAGLNEWWVNWFMGRSNAHLDPDGEIQWPSIKDAGELWANKVLPKITLNLGGWDLHA